MDDVRERIEQDLKRVMDRLRQLGSAVVIEKYPGAIGDGSFLPDLADQVQAHEEQEMSWSTRSLLVERANRLAEALQRLREGTYGTCEECGEAIAPARLKAMPEVTTCIRCQDRLERVARLRDTQGPSRAAVFVAGFTLALLTVSAGAQELRVDLAPKRQAVVRPAPDPRTAAREAEQAIREYQEQVAPKPLVEKEMLARERRRDLDPAITQQIQAQEAQRALREFRR